MQSVLRYVDVTWERLEGGLIPSGGLGLLGAIVVVRPGVSVLLLIHRVYIYILHGFWGGHFFSKTLDGQINVSSLGIFHIHCVEGGGITPQSIHISMEPALFSSSLSVNWILRPSIFERNPWSYQSFGVRLSWCPLRERFRAARPQQRRHDRGPKFLKPSCFQSLKERREWQNFMRRRWGQWLRALG